MGGSVDVCYGHVAQVVRCFVDFPFWRKVPLRLGEILEPFRVVQEPKVKLQVLGVVRYIYKVIQEILE